MIIKYKNKTFSSEDLPIFVYFKTDSNRKEFLNQLVYYKLGEFCRLTCVHSILAGNTVIKNKRAYTYFKINDKEEKRLLQRSLWDNDDPDNNAMMCAPPDIKENNLLNWVEKHLDLLD